MSDANLSQQQLSSKHNDSFQTIAHSQQLEHLLQDTNFTLNLSSQTTSFSDSPSWSFQKSDITASSSDFAQENKIGDVGSLQPVENSDKEQAFHQISSKSCEDCVIDENRLLDAKKKQLLAELEAGIFVKESVSCLNMKAGILEGFNGVNDSVQHSVNVEMVDIGPGSKLQSCVGSAITAERNDNRGNDGTKSRRNREMEKKYSRKEMEDLRFVNVEEQNFFWRNVFSGLGNGDVVEEYNALATNSNARKNNCPRRDRRQNHGRRETPIFLGEISSKSDEDLKNKEEVGTENINVMDPSCCSNIEAEDTHIASEETESCKEYDSDEDYTSIQKPAFYVEGEPDFDSGPPEDGLEYLRRVRWEAAHIPKVKVAKLGRAVDKEQSVYMPQIPDIAKCPVNLLPSEQWENAFLADFLELRQLLSCDEDSGVKISSKLPTMSIVDEDGISSSQLTDSFLFKKIDDLVTDEPYSCDDSNLEELIDQQSLAKLDDGKTSTSSEKPNPSKVAANISYPSLTAILSMDSVARLSMLRKRIWAAETMDTLSRDDCVWLFSLCAAVDTPLDADTSAALRSLLRKCASLRAAKSELDDEVIMLNILATISGKYFGQSER